MLFRSREREKQQWDQEKMQWGDLRAQAKEGHLQAQEAEVGPDLAQSDRRDGDVPPDPVAAQADENQGQGEGWELKSRMRADWEQVEIIGRKTRQTRPSQR